MKDELKAYARIQKVNRRFLFTSIIVILATLVLPITALSNLQEVEKMIQNLDGLSAESRFLISLSISGTLLTIVGFVVLISEYKNTSKTRYRKV